MGSASERRRYNVKSSPIGWTYTLNDPCLILPKPHNFTEQFFPKWMFGTPETSKLFITAYPRLFSSQKSQKTPHSAPLHVSYGLCVRSNFDQVCAILAVVLCQYRVLLNRDISRIYSTTLDVATSTQFSHTEKPVMRRQISWNFFVMLIATPWRRFA